ncbi:hyalin isoform X2 [Strongylocentrotus purpuratus]|uniref:HYR domain-containing protein n=1 Tax=Strongylocentrotus purpuratus TaxID=7668 RepID=A0A7M7N3A3_STRPU|nr:hyalin isoform X2 [Strongylocentrotus purpuratus]
MELCSYHLSTTRTYVWICGIFFILSNGANGQVVTCNSVDSDKSNVFETYNVAVSGNASYNFTYEPEEYGPTNRLPVGTNEVTVTAYPTSSPSTATGNCTFNVTVSLSELPIACPITSDVESTDPGESTFQLTVSNLALISGFDYIPVTSSFIESEISTNTTGVVSDRFPIGVHAMSVRYFDSYLAKECNFTLTVVDMEPPTVTCPAGIVTTTTNVITYTPMGIADNVPDPSMLQGSISYIPDTLSPGSRFPFGISTVTISITDGAGNQGNCSFDVNVSIQDLPIVCPMTPVDLTVGTDSGEPFYTYQDPQFIVTYLPESTTYDPYGSITMMRTYGGSSSSPELAISPSAHTVNVIISDGTLSKSCTEARVTVEDREPPVIVCPDDIYQDHTSVDSTFQLKSSSDNSGEPVVDFSLQPFIRDMSYPIGTTTYTFTSFDSAGNNASCSFNVTIEIAPQTPTPQEPTNAMESTAESTNAIKLTTAGALTMPNNLPIIIGCSVAGVVLLIIIVILAVICSNPGRRSIFGIGAKEPSKIRQVGASRHGVATDPVLLADRLERTRSNIYATNDFDVEMEETPEMTETNGAAGGLREMTETNGMDYNDLYGTTDELAGKSVL